MLDALDEWIHGPATWLESTPLSMFLQAQDAYAFAAEETLHLIGMTLMLGAIGAFDLRVLGLAKAIPPGALHRLIPWGVAGFIINVATGLLFVIAHPHQYLFDPAFRVKVVLIALAGLNVLAFYGTAFRELMETPAGSDPPLRSRLITGISLTAWVGVLICGGLVSSGYFG
jgi:hypothetical protein